MKKYLLTIFLLIISISPLDAREPVIRVAILNGADSFVVSARGSYTVLDLNSQEQLHTGRRMKRSKVAKFKDGITIGKKFYDSKKLRISGQKDITVYSKRKRKHYRGSIDIHVIENNQLLVINRLDIESYVRGVLYHEISDRWPIEATKAQAVATRTYALYRIQENQGKLFDVTSDIYSQVYGGRSAERFRTDIAANYTEGEILVYDGQSCSSIFSFQ